MATNPMQRKARNSFLLGMLIMLLISAVIIAFLFIQLINMKKAEQELEKSYITVYTLGEDVKSGDEIPYEALQQSRVARTAAPTDYLTPSDLGEKNIAKITMTTGTVLSKEMVYTEDDTVGDNVRKEEYNMIILPSQLVSGDFVDIRLMFPTGEDYIVISKKKVEVPIIGGEYSEDTIWLELTEDEILTMSNAIYEAFTVPGSKLYANLYTDPGIQKASTPTYPIKQSILSLVNGSPNVVQEARTALWQRYNATDSSGNRTQVQQRNEVINRAIEDAGQQGVSNQQTNMEESITNTKTERREWLDSLGGTASTSTSN